MGLFDNLTYAYGSEPGANTNLELRRRIALSMLSGKKGFPKNLGEGLSAIGDAIGDRGLMNRVEREDAQAQAAARALGAGLSGGSASTNAAPVVNEGPDAETPRALAPVEPSQPSAMLAEDSRMPGAYTPPAQQPSSLLSPKSELGGTAPRLASGSFTPPAQPQTQPLAADAGFNSLDAMADPKVAARSQAIGGIESGGKKNPYATLGMVIPKTGDRAYGKYQIMGANIPLWTKEATGTEMTPEQFLADPNAQEATFQHRFGQYADKYGDEGAAKAWYAGERGMNNPSATDPHGRLTVAGYGQDYMNRLGGQGDPRAAVAATLAARQQNAPVMAYAPPSDVQSDAPPIGFAPQPSPQRDAIAQTMAGSTPATMGTPAPDQRLAQASTALPSYRPGPLPAPAVARPAQAPTSSQAPARPEGRPVPPLAPVPVGISPREAQLEQLKIDNQNNPYAAPQIDRVLGPIKAAREAENARRVEEYKAKLQHHNALDLDYVQNTAKRQREEALAPSALTKAQAEAVKAQNDARAGVHTTVEGRLMIPDPNKPMGSPWIDVTAPRRAATGDGPPVPSKPLTEHQDKSQKFLTQMILGEKQLEGKEKLLATSPMSDVVSGFGGRALTNRNYKIARGAADFSVAANLRDISGAVIGETEQVRQYKMNMPKYGDSDIEIAAKRDRRKAIMDSMYAGLGEDGRALVDYSKKKMHEQHDEVQRKINEEMSHLKDKPKGYRATKGGMARVWDGKNWLDD